MGAARDDTNHVLCIVLGAAPDEGVGPAKARVRRRPRRVMNDLHGQRAWSLGLRQRGERGSLENH